MAPISDTRWDMMQRAARASDEFDDWKVGEIYSKIKGPGDPALPQDLTTEPEYRALVTKILDHALRRNDKIMDVARELVETINNVANTASKRKRSETPPTAASKSKRHRPIFSTWAQIQSKLQVELANTAASIGAFCAADHPIPLWVPDKECWKDYPEAYEHIQGLHIPATPAADLQATLPDLLLHDVGLLDQLDEFNSDFGDKMRAILESNSHRALADASGAGKTRMLLEILSRGWGFYFSSAYHEVKNPYGSSDVAKAVAKLATAQLPDGTRFAMAPDLYRNNEYLAPHGRVQATNNWVIAEHVFSQLLLARILVFDLFRELCPAKLNGPLLWLLLQVAPGNGNDLFARVFSCLEDLNLDETRTQINERMKQWPPSLVPRLAIDEAQVLVISDDAYRKSFASSARSLDGREVCYPRPVFKPLVEHIWSYFRMNSPTTRFLWAGTRFCFDEARDALSGDMKGVELAAFSVSSGIFGTDEVKKYLAHYLTWSVVNAIEPDVLHDVEFWLSGRHRFLAYLVQWTLQLGPLAIRRILHSILLCLTRFPLYENVVKVDGIAIKPLLSDELESSPKDYRKSLAVAIFAVVNFVVTGKYDRIGAQHMDLVELGIGKFSDSVEHFYIRENLVLACLMRWLSDPSAPMNITTALNPGLMQAEPTAAGFSFENALIYLLWRYFTSPGSSRSLSSLCKFFVPGSEPDWALQPAQLVSHFDSAQQPVILQPGLTTSLALTGASPTDTIDWLTGRTRIPFFKPDKYMGPDICFRVALKSPESDRPYIVLICVQCKNGDSPLTAKQAKYAIFTVSPEHFYRSKHAARRPSVLRALPALEPDRQGDLEEDDAMPDADADADADAMDTSDDDSAYDPDELVDVTYTDREPRFAILRVIGSLPEKVRMPRDVDNLGCYPLAQVKKRVFEDATVEFDLFGFQSALEDDTLQRDTRFAKEAREAAHAPTRRVTRSQTSGNAQP